MKRRLTMDEYNEVINNIELMQGIYRQVLRMTSNRFPKNGKAVRKMTGAGKAISTLYDQMQEEFFQDFLRQEMREIGKQH